MEDIKNRTILQGDVLDKLKEIPNNTFDCIISSPPYWGLRDYNVKGQLGLEPDFRDYLKIMASVMDELKRVLKGTGSCWINLGDTYSSGGGKGTEQSFDRERNIDHNKEQNYSPKAKYRKTMAKSRFGIPERFYIDCIDSGWIARNHIPWYKSNSMPQSVKDRLSNKWESIFFFVKEQKYYFNLNAIREKSISQSKSFNTRVRDVISDKSQQKLGDLAWTASDKEIERYNKDGTKKYESLDQESKHRQGMNKDRGNNLIEKRDLLPQKQFVDKIRDNFNINNLVKLGLKRTTVEHWFRYDNGFSYPSAEEWKKVDTKLFPELLDVWYETDHINQHDRKKQDETLGADGNPKANYAGFNERYKNRGNNAQDQFNYRTQKARDDGAPHDNPFGNSIGKNPGDVFFINPKPFTEAHFAVFPVELPEYILKCACPQQVCSKCGIPRYPISKPTAEYRTIEYTKCNCNDEFIPGMVLDPFMGAGTTAVAAEQAGLSWCGIELKEEFCTIARKRLKPYMNDKL